MDFYKFTSTNINKMSTSELNIFNYVIKNMQSVKKMSIRELADTCYVSSTTLFRFVKKIGYEGYSDFIEAVRAAELESHVIRISDIVTNDNYRDSYLKSLVEAVMVVVEDKVERFNKIFSGNPHICILAEGLSEDVARYFYRLLTVVGYDVTIPKEEYELKLMAKKMKHNDILFVLSFSGNNAKIIGQMEQVLRTAAPTIVSMTRADNNIIQNMSDLNLYVFADEIDYDGVDITSRCGMIAVFETLIYKLISLEKKNENVRQQLDAL